MFIQTKLIVLYEAFKKKELKEYSYNPVECL